MTCAKKQVYAMLVTKDGKNFVGYNDCDTPQDICPRDYGEGYGKCYYVCGQRAHAELDAIRKAYKAGSDPQGGLMIIDHHRVCSSCWQAMEELNIRWRLLNG